MDPDKEELKNDSPDNEVFENETPSDALSTPPEDPEKEATDNLAEIDQEVEEARKREKRRSPIKSLFKKINIYLLMFMFVVAIAAAVVIVAYINSTNTPARPEIAGQDLTAESLKQLSNSDASIGDSSQTLTIRGNAVIDGQTLMRNNLNVAGDIQSSGSFTAPSLTVADSANLGETQARSLQVQNNVTIQGDSTLNNLSVSGASSFSGAITASQITVTRLIMSGTAVLEVPNHIRFTGPTPNRSINSAVLGRGGSLSINGSDTAGTIAINTGTDTVAGCFARIDFNKAFESFSRVIVSPVGSAAGRTQYYVDRDNRGFSICTNNAAPTGQTFAFDYFVTN